MPEKGPANLYLEITSQRVDFLVGKNPQPFPLLNSNVRQLENARSLGFKPRFYSLSDERLTQITSPDYMPSFETEVIPIESPAGPKREEKVELAELRQNEDYNIEPELDPWESPEVKTKTIIEIKELESKFSQNPDDISIQQKIEELKAQVITRDERLIFWAVRNLAPWYKRKLSDHLIYSAGASATLKAIKAFDPGRGCHFTTYQVYAIITEVGKVAKSEAKTIQTPDSTDSLVKNVFDLQERMIQEKARYVSTEEVLEQVGYSDSQKNRVKNALWAKTISLNKPLTPDEDDGLDSFIADKTSTPEEQAVITETGQFIRKVLVELSRNDKYGENSLSFHESRALDLKFGLSGIPLDTEEIANELGIKRRKVPVLLTEALRKIRNSPFAEELLDCLRSLS